jgi:hypothetical protein
MNCKQGDLAYIVDSGSVRNIGRLVSVCYRADSGDELPAWACIALSRLVRFEDDGSCTRIRAGDEIEVFDADLRPILPPPGTVTDEEVRDLYSPESEKVLIHSPDRSPERQGEPV